MGTVRASREAPRAIETLRAGAFDDLLLRAVGRMQVATLPQLSRLTYDEPSATARRLRQLVAAGLLRVGVSSMNAPNLYGLTRKGMRTLVSTGVESNDLFLARDLRTRDRHLEAINDLRVALSVGVRGRADLTLDLFLADHDLRRRGGVRTPHYLPDALVRVLDHDEPRGFVLEVDAGTEHGSQFRGKVETTVTLHERGLPVWGLQPFRPVLVAFDDAGARRLARVVVEAGGGDLWIVTTTERMTSDPYGPVYATASMIAATPKGTSLTFENRIVRASPVSLPTSLRQGQERARTPRNSGHESNTTERE